MHVGVALVDVLWQHLRVPNVIPVDVLVRGDDGGSDIGHLDVVGEELRE